MPSPSYFLKISNSVSITILPLDTVYRILNTSEVKSICVCVRARVCVCVCVYHIVKGYGAVEVQLHMFLASSLHKVSFTPWVLCLLGEELMG